MLKSGLIGASGCELVGSESGCCGDPGGVAPCTPTGALSGGGVGGEGDEGSVFAAVLSVPEITGPGIMTLEGRDSEGSGGWAGESCVGGKSWEAARPVCRDRFSCLVDLRSALR